MSTGRKHFERILSVVNAFSSAPEQLILQDATIRCLLSTSVSPCFGHHYAHLQENKDRVTAYDVLLLFS